MNILIRVLFLFLCVLSSGRNSAAQTAEGRPNRRETILIIGVQHAPGQFRSEKFSPAHIRAALEAFKPQVIGVESNPEWFARGQFYRSTYEAQLVAVPFARDHKIPVYGIDWVGNQMDKTYAGRRHIEQVKNIKKILESPAIEPAGYRYGLSSWDQQTAVQDDPELDFYVLNGSEFGAKSVKWIDEGKGKKGSPEEYMEKRDNHIVDYITAVADKHAGSRIAVVIGALHKADLERKLRARGFEVIGPQSVERAVPFSDGAKMDGRLTAQDIAAILAEAWDTTPRSGIKRERAERLLERLRELADKDPKAQIWSEYFSARQKMLGGDYPAAGRDFQKIIKSRKLSGFPLRSYTWRHHLTVQQAALLELGRMADLQGRREEAAGYYNQLLLSIKIPEYSEDIHSDYLFVGTAYSAVRFLAQNAYSKALEAAAAENIPGPPPPAAAATPATAPPPPPPQIWQEAMNLSRNKKWPEAAVLIEEVLKKGEASPRERCFGYIGAAYNYAMEKKAADAKRHLKSFDAECSEFAPEGSTTLRERKYIEELLR